MNVLRGFRRSIYFCDDCVTSLAIPATSLSAPKAGLAMPAKRKKAQPETKAEKEGRLKTEKADDVRVKKVLQLFEEKFKAADGRTADELAQAAERAKEFSRLKFKQHRDHQMDDSAKQQLAKAALAALPEHLREAAKKEDQTPVPNNFPNPTHTPPSSWT